MKTHLRQLSKSFALVLLLLTAASSCKKETTIKPGPEPVTKTSSAKGKIDGKDFTIKESGLKSTLYTSSGDAVKSLETSATLDANGNKLTFFIDDLKNGAINLTKKTGTSLNPGTRTIKLDANTVQSYVYYYNGGNTYFAYSGKIEMILTDVDVTVTWNINFKDATGREFNSSGSFTITFATVVTKPKSEVKDPTPVADKPTIESISPTKGRAGDEVAITGVNYSATAADNVVKFNGTNAEVISATATKLTVKAPAQGTSGSVSVKVKNSEVTTGPSFTYIQAATLTSFSPASAKVGETVTISGTNFSTVAAENVVKFAGAQGTVTATVTEATATQLKVTVPQGAATGKITLNVLNGGDLSTATNFTLNAPATLGDWEDMRFNTAISESNISASDGTGFMFTSGTPSSYLYYTANGTTYANIIGNLPFDKTMRLTIKQLAVDVNAAGGPAYYVTTNLGIAKTQDGGAHWTELHPAGDLSTGFNSIIARNNNVFLLYNGFIYTSHDGGANWEKQYTATGAKLDYITADSFGKYWYAIDASDNYLNSGVTPKIYKSTDQGKTWSAAEATTGIYFYGSGNLDFITASGYTIFCLYSPSTAAIGDQRLYKTTNQGATWTKVSDENVYYVKSFGDYVVYGDGRFNVSNDGGVTFKNYPVPENFRVGGVVRVSGYFYVLAYDNSGQHRIFRIKL